MSSDEPFQIETTPMPDEIQFLDDRLYEYNMNATGIRNGELLAIFVRDSRGAIEAGISGWTWGDCSSYSFQAPEFYQKLGYEQWAVLDSYPNPHHECYLKKRL